MSSLATTLIVVAGLAALAPVIARIVAHWVKLPVIVFELMLGIAVGPTALGLVEPAETLDVLADIGVAMLFFMAGSEIDGAALRGRTGRNAWIGWFLSFGLGLAVGWLLVPGIGAVVIAIALSSTALGTLIPVLRDSNDLDTPFGKSVSAVGAIGEFAPIIAISVVLSNRTTAAAIAVLVAFGVIAALAIWQAGHFARGRLHMHRFVESTLHTSGQFAIRLVILILAALAVLSLALHVDMLLGAFTAGLVWRALIADASPDTQEAVESKVEGLAFGFLIPIFFISTGINFDLSALLKQPWTLTLVPVVALTLLVVRGLPSGAAAPRGASRRDRTAVILMGATGLPLIIVATQTGVENGYLSSTVAAVLVAGGMLSVLLFPALATSIRSGGEAVPAAPQ